MVIFKKRNEEERIHINIRLTISIKHTYYWSSARIEPGEVFSNWIRLLNTAIKCLMQKNAFTVFNESKPVI